jgi:hypothetical protein
MNFYSTLLVLLSLCVIVHSCTHRLAKARIINRTGVKIKFLNLVHQYGDIYTNARIFSNIESNSSTSSYLYVDYHTGFLCYGTDWWWLAWADSNNQLHIIDPKSNLCFFDGQKPLAHVNSIIFNREALRIWIE